MKDFKVEFEGLEKSFTNYKLDAERQMKMLIKENMRLERDINSLVNIVEISKFVNLYFANEDLISLINDMIIGVLGVSYSTIYMVEEESIEIKASNISKEDIYLTAFEKENLNTGKDFRINSNNGIKEYKRSNDTVKSIMGIPIELTGKYLGYIIVEHTVSDYLDENSELFLKSICNQIGVAIENSNLYRKLQEASKRDPLLGIYNRKYFFEKVE
ncbi:MAG: GAF domain-containing protein, partial [Clostridium sp.]